MVWSPTSAAIARVELGAGHAAPGEEDDGQDRKGTHEPHGAH